MQHRAANDNDPWWLVPAAFMLNPGLWLIVALVGIKWVMV